MRLLRLEVDDFGPYRGTQRYDFATAPGVELLWGENGRGKTSLLNAIRYALFGVVLGRASVQLDLTTVGNREQGASEPAPFKTTLTFEHDGETFKLTRAYGVSDGAGGVRERVSLIKDGDVLGPEERDQQLARLLPEQIARFFLFDAELLQEYEQLLNPGQAVQLVVPLALGAVVALVPGLLTEQAYLIAGGQNPAWAWRSIATDVVFALIALLLAAAGATLAVGRRPNVSMLRRD